MQREYTVAITSKSGYQVDLYKYTAPSLDRAAEVAALRADNISEGCGLRLSWTVYDGRGRVMASWIEAGHHIPAGNPVRAMA